MSTCLCGCPATEKILKSTYVRTSWQHLKGKTTVQYSKQFRAHCVLVSTRPAFSFENSKGYCRYTHLLIWYYEPRHKWLTTKWKFNGWYCLLRLVFHFLQLLLPASSRTWAQGMATMPTTLATLDGGCRPSEHRLSWRPFRTMWDQQVRKFI